MSLTLIAIVGMSCGLTTRDFSNYAEGLDLNLSFPHEADLRIHEGFLPVEVKGIQAGVETYFDRDLELLKSLPLNESIDYKNSEVVTFRWGSRFKEGATGFYLAYLLIERCDAALFDPEGGEYMSSYIAKLTADYLMVEENKKGLELKGS